MQIIRPAHTQEAETQWQSSLDINVDYQANQNQGLGPFLDCIRGEGQVVQRWPSITVTSHRNSLNPLLDLRYPTRQLRAANFRWQDLDHDTSRAFNT